MNNNQIVHNVILWIAVIALILVSLTLGGVIQEINKLNAEFEAQDTAIHGLFDLGKQQDEINNRLIERTACYSED